MIELYVKILCFTFLTLLNNAYCSNDNERMSYTINNNANGGDVAVPSLRFVNMMDSTRNCSKMSEHCRLETYTDSVTKMSYFNMSCHCYHDKFDVYRNLHDLISRPCPHVPRARNVGQYGLHMVDYAQLSIINCVVEIQPLPEDIISALRRSRHLSFDFQNADVRLPAIIQRDDGSNEEGRVDGKSRLDSITFTAVASSFSGLSHGIVSGGLKVRLSATDCNLGIWSDGAIADFDAAVADVDVRVSNSNLTKLAKNSVVLPLSGQLIMEDVRLESIDGGAVGGQGEVSLRTCRPGSLHRGAFNISRLTKLELYECVLGSVEDTAILSSPHSPCHVIVRSSHVMRASANAFQLVCHAAQVTWQGNTVMQVLGGKPLLLESLGCPLAPSSIIGPTSVHCNTCDFTKASANELCAIYSESLCSMCQDCSPMSLEYHLTEHCPGGPALVKNMARVCRDDNTHHSQPDTPFVSPYTDTNAGGVGDIGAIGAIGGIGGIGAIGSIGSSANWVLLDVNLIAALLIGWVSKVML